MSADEPTAAPTVRTRADAAPRIAALVVIALAQLFLLLHSQEPLRLNVGDPWSDANVLTTLPYVEQYGFRETSFTDVMDVGPLTHESYRYTHYPPLAEIFYGAVHAYLGVDSIGTMRLFAIAFSALALAMLYQYVRRLYDARIALLATMLWSTNLLWLMYADSIHQAPIMQASAFTCLWGLIRALDEPRRRYWLAAWLGAFACFLASYDDWIFLPIAVLVTVGARRGNPLRGRNRWPVALCASGCLAAIALKCAFVIGAVGWHEFVADVHFQFLERSTDSFERDISAIPSLVRRATMVFSPLVWPVVAVMAWRTLRARSFTAALHDGAGWLLATALLFFVVFRQLAASQVLASQVALPFVTVATAMLALELWRRAPLGRIAAVALVAVPPLWSAALLHAHPRSFLEARDVARVNAYLRAHDRNDFLVSNLLADGPIQACFGRHYWPADASDNRAITYVHSLGLLAVTGRDHYHALIFKQPSSRMIDKSLWPLAAPRRQWSVTGWPFLWRAKSERMIRGFDRLVVGDLEEVGGRVVSSSPEVDLYEVTRARVEERARARVGDATLVDLGSYSALRHLWLGWGEHRWLADELLGTRDIVGYAACPSPGDPVCRSVLTKTGVVFRGQARRPRAELMMKAAGGCDVDVIVTLGRPAALAVRLDEAAPSTLVVDGARVTARFPAAALVAAADDLHLIALEVPADDADRTARGVAPAATVATVELRRQCAP